MRGLNYKTRFIDLAGELNTEMPLFWVRKVGRGAERRRAARCRAPRSWCSASPTSANIDDLRESPALDIIRLLEAQGAHVEYHDPRVQRFTEDGVERVPVSR